MNKGQVTVEYIIVTGIVSIIFLMSFNFIVQERKQASYSILSLDGKDNAEKLAQSINSVHLAGDGASMNVTMPKRLVGGVNYTITVYRRLVALEATDYDHEFEWKFMTADVDGSGSGLRIDPGKIVIENINGTIYLSSS